MRRMLLGMVSALALGGALADDNDWVYTPETHTTIPPTNAEGILNGLDARPRGFGYSLSATVDKWFWTYGWGIGEVYFGPTGIYLFVR